MAQPPEERRLRRIASAYNRDAANLGQGWRVAWDDLHTIELGSDSCVYCGIGLEYGQGTFDHATPLDRGGANTWQNLFRCCYTCQREKGTKTEPEYRMYRDLMVACAMCGTLFRPRWGEWKAGRGKLCSRRCSALKRWAQ